MGAAKNTRQNVNYVYSAGLDIGNGYVKGVVIPDGTNPVTTVDEIDMPSVTVGHLGRQKNPRPDYEASTVMGADFFNEIEGKITSPLVSSDSRRVVGHRSTRTGGMPVEFDIVGNTSKAHQELSKTLTLMILAAKTLKDAVEQYGHVPGSDTASDTEPAVLTCYVTAALALPIDEYVNYRRGYAMDFLGNTDPAQRTVHTVTVTNFETPVTVRVIFNDVKVIAEGASAQYAIVDGGEALMNGLLADVRAKGIALEGITAQDVLEADSTIGIDIGEGTVNFPVFTHGQFNTEASRTLSKGYGMVLDGALDAMKSDAEYHLGFTSRKQLSEFLVAPKKKLHRGRHELVQQLMVEPTEDLVALIVAELAKVLADVGAVTDVIYVYGGGSGPLRDVLYDALLAKVQEMNSADACPVLYLDASYSRNLNREGLSLIAQTVAKK